MLLLLFSTFPHCVNVMHHPSKEMNLMPHVDWEDGQPSIIEVDNCAVLPFQCRHHHYCLGTELQM